MHADRTNRTALILFGVLLLLTGAAGLATNLGLFGHGVAHKALFANFISRYIGQQGGWIWPVFAVVCAFLALVCLRWILTLLVSTDRAGEFTVSGDRTAGRTTVQPGALTSAVVREIETYRGVDTAKARLIGDTDRPDLVVTVTAAQSVDLGALRRRIESEAFAHVRQAMGEPDLPIQFDLAVSRHTPDRVG